MTGESLTPEMKLIVWALVGKKGQALQSDLGLKVNPSARDALKSMKFISDAKVDRSIYLRIEDKGWHWAAEHLLDDLAPAPEAPPAAKASSAKQPPAASKAQPGQKILQSWLALVHDYLKTSGTSLPEFIGPLPEPVETPVKVPKPKVPRKPAKPKPLTKTARRKRIEAAYLTITNGRKAENVPLSKLRAELSDLDRATIDRGLADILKGDKKLYLGPISDDEKPTAADNEAAFSPSGGGRNFFWIESKPPKQKTLSKPALRKRIEAAYLAITDGRKAEHVPLSKLRAELSDLDRATVDKALLNILQGGKKAGLSQISDNKALTEEERKAAFDAGGGPLHVIWIKP